jgi:uroporphyrinogen-III synthase
LDAVTFASASSVRHFHQLFPGVDLTGAVVACIGPSTEAAARELGLPVTAVASVHTAAGLAEALVALFSR